MDFCAHDEGTDDVGLLSNVIYESMGAQCGVYPMARRERLLGRLQEARATRQ